MRLGYTSVKFVRLTRRINSFSERFPKVFNISKHKHIERKNGTWQDIRKKREEGDSKLSLCLTKHHAVKAYWGVEV
jgi:hypothetical protein